MKKLTHISTVLFFVIGLVQSASSQNIGDLSGIYYQAVAVDEYGKEIVGMDVEGKPLYEKEIGVRFTITKGANGSIQWEEIHTTVTDKYGLFSLIIGQGTQTGNGGYTKMLDIPWIDADQFLKVEISTKNDGDFRLVSNQQFMSVPYSFYTDDIADDAITTAKILNEAILAEDINTSAVETSEILDETILAEDIATGAVTTSEILNETILAEDIATGAVTTDEMLDETILAGDIAASAVTTSELMDKTILAEDIGAGSVTTSEILDETIVAEDVAVGAVATGEILNGTLLNEDIANSTIDLTSKVTGVLPVVNGGMGNAALTVDNILVGNGANPIAAKILASADSSLLITQTADSIILKTQFSATEVTSDPAGTFVINNLPAGSTYTSNAINSFAVDFGDIILGSIDADLQGCMLTAYVSNPNVIRISIYNGTGGAVNLGTVNVRVYVVK
ncbi:MAG: hypothetical protein A2W95_07560 [Bacteroidetes bacterium GWA2_40_14]|nr:MAG: hypothetical protein A2W95_07560 [Bacteroidetes bacterium GWA2_40_14]HAZ01424.1 hypothetical protein [Marinilabiliales bacterium]